MVGPDQGASLSDFSVSPEIISTDKTDTTSIRYKVKEANFKQAGVYKIKLQMKQEKEEVFYTIAEKNIEVMALEKKAEGSK